jgi:uncharacterized protein (DUF58 family)
VKLIRSLYLNNRLFLAIGIIAIAFIVSFIASSGVIIGKILFFFFLAVVLTDIILLFRTRKGLHGSRKTPEKLSNGDENEIKLSLENFYPFVVRLNIVDEIPHQFQRRDLNFELQLNPGESKIIKYFLRPVKRGEYSFGAVNVFCELANRIL